MGLMQGLAAIAGGRRKVFEDAPGDLIMYAAMGGVIVSTAVVATASATMAVHTAMRLPIPGALVVGVVWGVIIFNLDRLLVVQMTRQQSKKSAIIAALPRVVLAIILGAVISTPVVLQIFKPEIDRQLIVMQENKKTDFGNDLNNDPEFKQIPILQKEISDDQAIVDRGVVVDVDSDPAVVAIRNQYNDAEKKYETAEHNVVCEKEGTCGSGLAGAGIAYHEKVQIRDDAKKTRDDLLNQLNETRATTLADLTTAQKTTVSAAQTRITNNQQKLNQALADRAAAEKRHDAQNQKDDGLLARLEALSQVSHDRPTLQIAHWVLFLLFLALELLPVMMKLLQVIGPETKYSVQVRLEDEHFAKVARLRRKTEIAIERDRVKRTRTAAVETNQVIVATQGEVMLRVLEAWREFALEQTERDLRDWNQKAGQPATGNTQAPQQPASQQSVTRPSGQQQPSPPPASHIGQYARRDQDGANDPDDPDDLVDGIYRPTRPTVNHRQAPSSVNGYAPSADDNTQVAQSTVDSADDDDTIDYSANGSHPDDDVAPPTVRRQHRARHDDDID